MERRLVYVMTVRSIAIVYAGAGAWRSPIADTSRVYTLKSTPIANVH
jgi:hypothetical protein